MSPVVLDERQVGGLAEVKTKCLVGKRCTFVCDESHSKDTARFHDLCLHQNKQLPDKTLDSKRSPAHAKATSLDGSN